MSSQEEEALQQGTIPPLPSPAALHAPANATESCNGGNAGQGPSYEAERIEEEPQHFQQDSMFALRDMENAALPGGALPAGA